VSRATEALERYVAWKVAPAMFGTDDALIPIKMSSTTALLAPTAVVTVTVGITMAVYG